jgi:hypothetical protein
MKLDFQCVKTHWNWGFMAPERGPYNWIVMLLAPVWPVSGFWPMALTAVAAADVPTRSVTVWLCIYL